jgi:hypothetical protein
VDTTQCPGAAGVTLVTAMTTFPLATLSSSPTLSQPARLSPTQFGFTLNGASGISYTVLAATDLALPLSNWFAVLVTNLPGNSAFIQDNHATNEQRFYRAVAPISNPF